MSEKKIAHIVPHTHWDREWRYPIWKNRMVLVEFMDQLLGLLDTKPNYKQFIMDGQSVIVEDYLAIRPENTEKVKKYIREGRLTCGPWYTLPDLYPLDGECLVRNLLKGFRVSKELGATLDIGYTSFGWGQTAQFPQIFAGFGIDFVVTAKNLNENRCPDSEFWWEAPDGTKILTTKLGVGARALFYVTTFIQSKYGVKNDENYHFEWNKSGVVYHKANAEDSYEDYFKMDEHDTFFPEMVKPAMEEGWKALDATTVKDVRFMPAGCDFSGALPELDKIIDQANKDIPDTEFKQSTLQDYVNSFKELVDGDKLLTIKGELRDGPSAKTSGNALSTRIYIKQLNKKAQNLLIHKAEPIATVVSMLGKEYPAGFLNKAWEYMLKSHPHDSINGVTQDKTVEDNMYRLNQVMELSGVSYEKSLLDLVTLADLSAYSEEDILLFAVNPLPFPVKDVIKVAVDLPTELDSFDFKVLDDKGNELPVQWVTKKQDVVPVHDLHARPWPFRLDRHIVHVETGEIPAGGFSVLKVVPTNRFPRTIISGPIFQRMSYGNEISRTHNTLENDFLFVEVNSNGTLKITNKETGNTYDGLHYFEDTGEVGDYWINLPPYENKTLTSHGSAAKIWLEDNGVLSATLGIEIKMEVPKFGHKDTSFFGLDTKRSEEQTIIAVKTLVTLKKGSKKVDLKVTVDNTAEDHRFRAMYPTGIKAEVACSAGHFGVDARPVMPKADFSEKYWVDMQTLPQQSFVDISDGKEGLAFINNCLTEYEMMNDGKSTLALTLFRSVRNEICSESRALGKFPHQKGGQALGLREYEYSIFPHTGDWESAKVFKEAKKFNVPATMLQVAAHKMGSVASGTSLFKIDSDDLVISAFKKAEDRDSYILRLFNPTGKAIESAISTYAPIKEAYLTNLNEVRETELKVVNGNSVKINAGHHKIVTIELVTK